MKPLVEEDFWLLSMQGSHIWKVRTSNPANILLGLQDTVLLFSCKHRAASCFYCITWLLSHLNILYTAHSYFLTPSSFSYFHREPVLWRTTDQITGLRKDAQLAQLQLPSRHQLLVAHLRRAEQCKLITLHFIQIESGSHQNFCYYYY